MFASQKYFHSHIKYVARPIICIIRIEYANIITPLLFNFRYHDIPIPNVSDLTTREKAISTKRQTVRTSSKRSPDNDDGHSLQPNTSKHTDIQS